MKLYIVGRESSDCHSEPEVFTDYDEAYAAIKREFDEIVEVIPEGSDIVLDDCNCQITEPNGDWYYWHITEHDVEEMPMITDGTLQDIIIEMTAIVVDEIDKGNADRCQFGFMKYKIPKWAKEFGNREEFGNLFDHEDDYQEAVLDFTIRKMKKHGYLNKPKVEMTVGYLKDLLDMYDCPDDTQIFVACGGECNYDFENDEPDRGTETFMFYDGDKIIITDEFDYGINSKN